MHKPSQPEHTRTAPVTIVALHAPPSIAAVITTRPAFLTQTAAAPVTVLAVVHVPVQESVVVQATTQPVP